MQGNNSSGASGGTTDDPLVGRTVGDHYIIEALLGSGAKGKVFRASHRKLHHTLLLKLMPVGWLGDGEARGQFEQDAKSLAGMEHDNITAVHDFGLEDRGVFLAEELVEGELLSEYVERRGALPLAEFVPIGAQILKGMGAAHARGLLHCDLKPGNIILCEHQGRANFVKICDLGLLQMIGGGGVDSKISAGTPGYMAPEQITDQQIDARADVYTIGVLFYLMLSGQLPYAGDSATNLLYKQVNERPTPLGEALPSGHDVPDGIISLVHSCLARNPDERPIDANEIVEHLIDSVPAALFRLPKAGSIPTVAGAIEPTPPPRPISSVSVPETRQREHSHPAIVPPAAPAPVTVSVDGAYNESTPVDDADEEESKSSGGVFIALLAIVAVGVGVYFYMQGLTPGLGGPQAPIAKAPTGQQVGTPADAKAAPTDQWLQAASGHEARREYDEAAQMYRKVLADQADNVVAMAGLKRVEAALAAPETPTDSSVNHGAGSDGSGTD
ncbi:MAG: serine/threonine-protein kinase, partial [Nannocystaceae bacterium]